MKLIFSMEKLSSLPFDPADLAKEASLLPPLPEDTQDEFSELRIMLIGIEEEDLLDVLTNHEITAETIPFVTETDLKRMNIANASEISKKLEVFREEKHRELSENEKLLFGEFSTTFTESDKNKIAANSTEHLKYLAGVTQFIKRKIRGSEGKEGILESDKTQFDEPACKIFDRLLDEIENELDQF